LSRLGFESYILNRLVYDRQDLIKKIVKEICYVCSVPEDSFYTQVETFKKPNGEVVTYPLNINDPKVFNAMYAKEIAKAKKYLYGNSYNKSK
jgi:hypothetical protein